jgi:hypothetical protein
MADMNRNKIKILVIIAIISYIQFGCSCGCGKNNSEERYVKGYITVVGNEPFTKLAVKTEDGKVYILKCSKELENDLIKKQGGFYYIQYTNTEQQEGVSVIEVEKAIPVIKEN